MLVKEIMDIGVAECTEDRSLPDVYDLIQTSSKDYVVVIDSLKHRVPIGIIDEHSICENLIRKSKAAKGLDAGSVLNTNIKHISENVEITECSELLDKSVDAILVVNSRRQFLGTVDSYRLEHAIVRARSQRPTFTSMIGQHIPAAVEIPAFGWLK
jgi:predicted transcriptional regulator